MNETEKKMIQTRYERCQTIIRSEEAKPKRERISGLAEIKQRSNRLRMWLNS